MHKFYKLLFTVLAILSISFSISAQNNFFTDAGQNRTVSTNGERIIVPQKFRTSGLDIQAMKNFLWTLPDEQNFIYSRSQAPIISLPMPDGSIARFHVWESSIQEPGLAAKFPEIRTFAGQGIDDPTATIRFDFNPYFGFSAQIRSSVNGRYFIDPYARRDVNNYICYFSKDMPNRSAFKCSVQDTPIEEIMSRTTAGPCLGTQLRTYRLAFTCTGEFAMAVGGGLAGPTHAAIVTGVNRLTQVYEDELAVRLVLIANNNLIEYLNPATDPWLNNGSITELNNITGIINGVVGSLAYDIGHLGCTASDAGVAGLGVVCGGSKGRGLTGGLNPVGDFYYIDFVAHEMGHQFGADHTYNSNNCASPGGSYEPGGGTTIMAYAGICSANENIQPNSDAIFHALSFDQIGNFVTIGSGCAVLTATGNTLPVINALPNNNISIPINTPFTLTATASDANGDAITYNWEGWDLGTAGSWPSAASSTTRPLFRTRLSKTSGSRTFPDIRVIAANYPGTGAPSIMDGLRGEVLPQVARTMKFRLTVRDNRAGGGGVVSAGEGCQSAVTFQVNAVGTTPFTLSAPNGGEVLTGGTTQTVTWNVAGTDVAPISTANVRLTLSSDGGLTYPIEIIASTPNDGTQQVTIPCVNTITARIRVEAVGNIFFDISNANFSIVPGFDFNSPAPVTSPCIVSASMSASLGTLTPCGFANPITLSASGNPAGTTVSFSSNPLAPGSSATVTLNGTNTLAAGTYNVTVTGTASGTPVKTRNISFIINAIINPSVTTQPAAQIVCAGSNATFTVTAANAATFQWQVSIDGGNTFNNIPNGGIYSGSNTITLAIGGVTTTLNNNRYRVVITSACATSANSTAVLLTVISPVSVATQPVASVLCSGSNTSFTVAGTSTETIVYQWQFSIDGGITYNNVSNGGVYSGATTANLIITGAVTGLNNNRYRCQLSNATCTVPTASNAAILNVRQLPTVNLVASPLTSLLPGQITTLTASPSATTGGTLTTTWLYNGAAPVPAITGNSYVVNVERTGTYQMLIQEVFTGPSLVCSNQSAIVTISAAVSSNLFIFPSPNDGRFTVSYYNNGSNSTKRKIAIFDSKGANVYNAEFAIAGPYTLLNINMERGSRGIYYVVVGDATGKKLADAKVHVR